MDKPKISIVTINWNNKAGLEKTCQSVAAQTIKPYEWIIIDGGSIDGSLDIINKYAEYVSYWVSEPDKGIYNAMNKGIDKTTGEYIQFLNSGDTLASDNVVKKMVNYIQNHPVDILVGAIVVNYQVEHIIPPKTISGLYLFANSLPHPAMFTKSSLLHSLHFNEDYKIASDWELSLKLLLLSDATYEVINEDVAIFDTEGLSSTHFWESVAERQSIWISLFGQRVYNDYVRMLNGDTILEKITCRCREYKFLYKLQTLISLPVYACYKIAKWLKL